MRPPSKCQLCIFAKLEQTFPKNILWNKGLYITNSTVMQINKIYLTGY